MTSKLYLHQAIDTHNDEYKLLSSGEGNTNIIVSNLGRIFNSPYDVGRCTGQIITRVNGKDYVVIVYFERASGPAGRPFIHIHAIIVDRGIYIENDLNFIYFKDKFIEYPRIRENLDLLRDLPMIEFSKPSDQYLEKLLNNILGKTNLRDMLRVVIGVIAGDVRPGWIRVDARSFDEVVDLTGALLQLLPPTLELEFQYS